MSEGRSMSIWRKKQVCTNQVAHYQVNIVSKRLESSNGILVKFLSVKFITFILISIAIALPLAYLFIQNWFQNFAYHTKLSLTSWIIAIFLSVLIAFLTILYHALRVAHKRPVEVLKYE